MLKVKRISTSISDIDRIKDLMLNAFPMDELTPFKVMFDKTDLDGYDFLAFYNEADEFSGIAYVACKDDLAYLFWLAVNENQRGNGIGSQILTELKNIYDGYRIILDIERINENASNNEQRIRRKRFYKRNGFTTSSLKYDLFNVEYEILINKGDVGKDEFENLYSYILDEKLNLQFLD